MTQSTRTPAPTTNSLPPGEKATGQPGQLPALSIKQVASKPGRQIVTLLVVFILAAALYGLWIPQDYSGDDLQYATVIYQAVNNVALYHPAGGRPYDPQLAKSQPVNLAPAVNIRYLLEWPTSIGAAQLWKWGTGSDEVITPIQLLRVLAGAVSITLFFLALQTLYNNQPIAGFSAAGLAVTTAFWTYSTRLDQSINMVAWLCLAFYLFVKLLKSARPVTLSRSLPLIASLTLASFYNFTAALTALSFGLALALALPATSWKERLISLMKFGLVYATLVVTIPLIILSIVLSPARLIDPTYWQTASFAGHPEWEVNLLADTFRAALGFAKSQVAYPGAGSALQEYWSSVGTVQRFGLVAFYGLVLIITLLPLGVMLLKATPGRARYQPFFGYMVIWFSIYTIFNIWWDPGYTKYWLVPLMAWWTIVGLAILKIKENFPRWYRPALVFWLVYLLLAFSLNLSILFLPGSDVKTHPWAAIARNLGQTYGAGALFISSGHELDFYISYFGHRDIISTRLVSYDAGGDSTRTQQIILSQVANHRASGNAVYYYAANDLTMDQEHQLLKLLNAQQLKLTDRFEQLTLYEVVF